ncbi:hypothetical protein CKO25_02020 [Thiocapsa imhoffii]|uniref:Uncharacterized protein n=1 Tax=Thiocapsa imhoffii TaxID=382777 RepID=A0A9X0WF02_9GAMM|nr:hypothetical protein [Thiocapsa imhoffii]
MKVRQDHDRINRAPRLDAWGVQQATATRLTTHRPATPTGVTDQAIRSARLGRAVCVESDADPPAVLTWIRIHHLPRAALLKGQG